MYAIEKKYDIEMKLKKETSNMLELRACAARGSSLAAEVCGVLGACERRLQQLEEGVLPLYGDTGRLQQIQHNMERTVKALDNVINYYMVARELADLIQAGPHTSSVDSLNAYLQALDKLAEAQNYFNKNNPQSVELENINQLYNSGVLKLENAFEDLVTRSARPVSPTTLLDMVALEEDSSVDSVSVSGGAGGCMGGGGGVCGGGGEEAVRAAAGWLSAAGRPPLAALQAARTPPLLTTMRNFREYIRNNAAHSPLMRNKNVLNRSDSTKKTSRIQKVIERRANKIMMKASQTLEQSTGLAIGPRKSMNDSHSEECSSPSEEESGYLCSTLAAALCRLARREQRYALGLAPLALLPPLLHALLQPAANMVAGDVQKACSKWRRMASKCNPNAANIWSLLGKLSKLQSEFERASAPASPAPYIAIVNDCKASCVRSLEDWLEGLAGGGEAPQDGTVHHLAAATLALLAALADHTHALGAALGAEAAYSRAASQLPPAHDRGALMLAVYMRKVLAQLNLTLRTKSEQYPDALKAIFLLNNTLYLLDGLQRSGLLEVLMAAEPDCERTYQDLIQEHKKAYLQSWNKLLSHTVLDEALPAKLRDRDRQMLKEKFSSFNRELEEASRAQRAYSVPHVELREGLKRENKAAVLPAYSRLHAAAAALPFTKNPDKYVKYTPEQVAAMLDGYFDEAA